MIWNPLQELSVYVETCLKRLNHIGKGSWDGGTKIVLLSISCGALLASRTAEKMDSLLTSGTQRPIANALDNLIFNTTVNCIRR